MSLLVKIGVASVIGFAATTGASAHTLAVAMDQSDLLAISEAPLDMSELSKARGGFKFGGFDFNFAVNISPVVIAPIGDVFPDGVFGAAGTEQGGVFGEGGVFGPNGVFSQNGPPPSSKDEVFGAGNNPGQTTSIPVTLTPVTSAPAQVIAEAPAQQSVQSSITYTPVVNNTVAPTISSEVLPTTEVPAPQPLRTVIVPTVVQSTQTVSSEGLQQSSPTPVLSKPAKQQSFQAISDSLTTVVSNTLNNVQFRKVVDLDVIVSNYDAGITRAIGASVTASITSTYGLLSRF